MGGFIGEGIVGDCVGDGSMGDDVVGWTAVGFGDVGAEDAPPPASPSPSPENTRTAAMMTTLAATSAGSRHDPVPPLPNSRARMRRTLFGSGGATRQGRRSRPPSTTIRWPVTNPAPSEAKKLTACAMSVGVPIRPTGTVAR